MSNTQQLENRIKELEEKLQMEKMVKKSEVLFNQELKERIEKLELHKETLIEVNEKYSDSRELALLNTKDNFLCFFDVSKHCCVQSVASFIAGMFVGRLCFLN